MADNPADAKQLMAPPVLARLCADPNLNDVRQAAVYLSRIIVAFDGQCPSGFAAYRPTAGPIRVAHEFWIDPDARCGLVLPAGAMLTALERAAAAAGCSRLFVVVARSMRLRLRSVFENSGYTISLAGGELTWFEKGLLDDGRPLESA